MKFRRELQPELFIIGFLSFVVPFATLIRTCLNCVSFVLWHYDALPLSTPIRSSASSER